MSNYQVLKEVSEKLREMVSEGIDGDPNLHAFVGGKSGISLANPKETRSDESKHLSLWLYHVTESEFQRNPPLRRRDSHDQVPLPPLTLNLFYLVTPFGQSADTSTLHELLGKVMQTLYDNAVVPLHNKAAEVDGNCISFSAGSRSTISA